MITYSKSLCAAMLLRVGLMLMSFGIIFSDGVAALAERRAGNSPVPSAQAIITPEISCAVTDDMCEVIAFSRSLGAPGEQLWDSVVRFIGDMTLDSFESYFKLHPGVIRVGASDHDRLALLKQFLTIFIGKITFERAAEGGSKTEKQRITREALKRSYMEKNGLQEKENVQPGTLHEWLKREISKKR